MRSAVPDWRTPDYARFRANCGATDPEDVHVAAAALSVAPCVLVTWNVTDFDKSHLALQDVRVLTPDGFLVELAGVDPIGIRAGIAEAGNYVGNRTERDCLDRLRRELPQFCDLADKLV